jgi:gluconolactonase
MKNRAWYVSLLVMLVAVVLVRAQTPAGGVSQTPGRGATEPPGPPTPAGGIIEKFDPALDAIISPNAKVELVAGDFGVAEGPVWIDDGATGYLLFSDIPANVIYKWTPDGQVSVFLAKSGYTGTDPLNAGGQVNSGARGRLAVILLGTNGLTLDAQGRVVMATTGDRNIARMEKDGTRTVLADRWDGKRFNGPNDLVVKSNGALYFTDAVYGLRGGAKAATREIPFFAVFLVKDGKVDVVGDKDGNPNGISISPDEKVLYVGSGGKILRYDIQPDDMLANGRVLIDSGTDGMKVDQKGNLYLTSRNVLIVSPEGKRLGQIRLPGEAAGSSPLNVAFGDADRKTLFIAAQSKLYRVRLNVAGTKPAVRY